MVNVGQKQSVEPRAEGGLKDNSPMPESSDSFDFTLADNSFSVANAIGPIRSRLANDNPTLIR